MYFTLQEKAPLTLSLSTTDGTKDGAKDTNNAQT